MTTQTPARPRQAVTPARNRAALQALQMTLDMPADCVALAVRDLERAVPIQGVAAFEIRGDLWTYAFPLHRVAVRILGPEREFDHGMRMADARAQLDGWMVFTFLADEVMLGAAADLLQTCIEHSRHRNVVALKRAADKAVTQLKGVNRYRDALALREAMEKVR